MVNTKLVVNQEEAQRVRAIFQLYLDHRSLIAVAAELNASGWQTKSWTTREGHVAPGLTFNKTKLDALLTNPLYIGRVRYKAETFPGEHLAIISKETWTAVQTQLALKGSTGGAKVRKKYGELLKGLLFCSSCKCAMSPTHTPKVNRRYRYDDCTNAQKTGWSNSPSSSGLRRASGTGDGEQGQDKPDHESEPGVSEVTRSVALSACSTRTRRCSDSSFTTSCVLGV